jgi:hypothetical protein
MNDSLFNSFYTRYMQDYIQADIEFTERLYKRYPHGFNHPANNVVEGEVLEVHDVITRKETVPPRNLPRLQIESSFRSS